MPPDILDDRITTIRAFNRFYTRQIGVLREGLLHSPYSITEVRVMYELAYHGDRLASVLGRELGLDQGYLSRIVGKFETEGLIEKVPSETDGRARLLRLTKKGRKVFDPLDRRSRDEVAEMLGGFSDEDQKRLLDAMRTIQHLLDERSGLKYAEPFFLRAHESGDMGWVTYRHGVIYAQEYGWDERFEALVAQICADFINNFDSQKEHCWIAEMNGEVVGSVFLAKGDEEGIAKLRLLLVEAKARGYGLGTRLVKECIRFAKRKGYRKIQLWTNSILVEARHIYKKTGFTLVSSEPHRSFGHDLVGETWEFPL
jgi:DNA-binding MarR family transcriptional regulator/N-acetylglutamate synthase-like GNAT family acetyltransferase